MLSGSINNPSYRPTGNFGRMMVSSLATLNGNWADIYSSNLDGLARVFDSTDHLSNVAFWTNLDANGQDSLHAKTLEAHFINADERFITTRRYGPTRVRMGSILEMAEWLYIHSGDHNSFLWKLNGGTTYQAEGDLSHLVGRRDSDGWSCSTLSDLANFMCYGPYTTNIPAGQHTATFRLLVDNNTNDNLPVVTIDVFDATTGRILAIRAVRRRDFAQSSKYQDFDISFTNETGHKLEFRTYWHRTAYVREDWVKVY